MNKIEIIVLEFNFTEFNYNSLLLNDNISNVFAATIKKSNPTLIDITISSTVNLKPCCSVKTRTNLAIRDYYQEFSPEMIFSLIEYSAQNSLQGYRIHLKKHCGFIPNMPDVSINDIIQNISINNLSIDPLSN